MRVPQQVEHLDQVVHHFHGPPGNRRGDEQSLTPAATPRLEEDANQLLRLEQRARHVAVAAHRAVVAVEAARIGHENAQQRRASPASGADRSEVQRPQRAGIVRISKARR